MCLSLAPSMVSILQNDMQSITCHAGIQAKQHTCRRALHRSPTCNDTLRVVDSNPEEGRSPCDRSARRTNRLPILYERNTGYINRKIHAASLGLLFSKRMRQVFLHFYLASILLLRLRRRRSGSLDAGRLVSRRLVSSILGRT